MKTHKKNVSWNPLYSYRYNDTFIARVTCIICKKWSQIIPANYFSIWLPFVKPILALHQLFYDDER